jgi:hypothetical protein
MLSSKHKRDSELSDPQRFGLQRRPPSVESLLCDRESVDVLPIHHPQPQRCIYYFRSAAFRVDSDQARGLPAHGAQSSALNPPTSSLKTENNVNLTNHIQAPLVPFKRLRLFTSGSKSALVVSPKGAGHKADAALRKAASDWGARQTNRSFSRDAKGARGKLDTK